MQFDFEAKRDVSVFGRVGYSYTVVGGEADAPSGPFSENFEVEIDALYLGLGADWALRPGMKVSAMYELTLAGGGWPDYGLTVETWALSDHAVGASVVYTF